MFGVSESDSSNNRDQNPLRQDSVEEREQFRKRGQRYKRLAIPFLVIAGVLFAAAVVAPIVMVATNGGDADGRGIAIIGSLFALPGVLFLIRSRKYRSLSANEVLENDPRPPVIYLRSFKDDKGAGHPLGIFRGSNIKYFWHWIFGFYNGPHELMGRSEEEILAQVLGTVGPVVAIGRPGEKLPQLGAARVYVEDAVWQEKVHEFLDRAALVVLRLGKTEGFWWEVEQSASRLDPRRLVFLVPLNRARYEEFRTRAEKYFPKGLPAYSSSPLRRIFGKRVDGKVRGLIYFKPDWTPVFVNLYKVRWPWKYKFHMMSRHYLANIYDWALQPVFEQVGAPWEPPREKTLMIAFKSLGYAIGSAYCVAIIGALLFVPYLLVSQAMHPPLGALNNQLIEAVHAGDTPKVESLLNRGADVNAMSPTGPDHYYTYPLTMAIQDDSPKVVRVLLDRGANPNINFRNETPLMGAADKNDVEIIRLLLSHGANIEERNDDSVTALVVAVESHDADAVQALLEGGASCDDTDASGKSVREVARATDWEDTPDMVSREKQILHLLKTQCAR
jgi:hypothetical protein